MNKRPPCEVADIIRAHGKQFLDQHSKLLDYGHLRVMHAIENCRTAILGGHMDACDRCGHRVISYNSCRNRHCPKCQGAARERWLANRSSELLPVPYFHVVFTMPQQLAPLALQNKRVVYGILFQAAAETLLEVAATPKHLGAEIGFLAVLHTWGQQMQHHPHLHCVIPGGGLSPSHTAWVHSRNQFLLPVKVLSRLFRGKFLAFLRKAQRKGKLHFHGALATFQRGPGFEGLLNQAYGCEWVVYTKAPFGGPEQVLRYLSRYTPRVAISNRRILSMADGNVTSRWKDYAHGSKHKVSTLAACEFLRRFSSMYYQEALFESATSDSWRTATQSASGNLSESLAADLPGLCWSRLQSRFSAVGLPGLSSWPSSSDRTHVRSTGQIRVRRFFLTMQFQKTLRIGLHRPCLPGRLATGVSRWTRKRHSTRTGLSLRLSRPCPRPASRKVPTTIFTPAPPN